MRRTPVRFRTKRYILFTLVIGAFSATDAAETGHLSCRFNKSVFVDANGIYEGPKWSSEGFTVKDDWVVLDKGGLKLKLTTNIQKFGTVILRGGESSKGYQFSLENSKFVYVLLMVPNARTWTVTGTCSKDVE